MQASFDLGKGFKKSWLKFLKWQKSLLAPTILIKKAMLTITISLVVFISCFVIRQQVLDGTYEETTSSFISVYVTAPNTGASFGMGANSSDAALYSVQIISIIVIALFFWSARNWWTIISVLFVLTGSIVNLADRWMDDVFAFTKNSESGATIVEAGKVYTRAVVDYLRFDLINLGAIFNLPDAFIICGSILTALCAIFWAFKSDAEAERKKGNIDAKEALKL